MRILMLVATDPKAEPYSAEEDNVEEWFEEVTARGAHLDGDRLRPAEEAKTVRVRDGRLSVTDGPFAETKEVIVGYDLLECADLDEAIDLASRHPMARFGRIELRALWPLD
ncbi:YciI family protein [Naasia sp. SYSU D00948]|uniref:YciI family protein n=1 Tax=Naasia sp. SYSU D00948 TaxID=2817379 RepID=UPI001B31138C|nr:YciI family protein [Naasia sp. SYSU D00948]